MKNSELEKLKYPIGEFIFPESVTEKDIETYKKVIRDFPGKLERLVADFTKEQFDTNYREGGWTVTQLIHHLADSHMNSYIRYKLALTEDIPAIKPYYEDKWAKLGDTFTTDAAVSLELLKNLHIRWYNLLESMTEDDFEKSFFHPEQGKEIQLKEITALYSWHCNHHFAHISRLKERNNW